MFALIAFTYPLLAQDAQKDMLALTEKYEQSYNKKKDKALKAMYTENATRINTDGTVYTGSETIRAAIAESFHEMPSQKVTIRHDKSETAADGTVTATGSYVVKGRSKAGEAIDLKGTYTNTVIKEKGQWKISKSVLVTM